MSKPRIWNINPPIRLSIFSNVIFQNDNICQILFIGKLDYQNLNIRNYILGPCKRLNESVKDKKFTLLHLLGMTVNYSVKQNTYFKNFMKEVCTLFQR